MGLLSFVQEAGQKLFNTKPETPTGPTATAPTQQDVEALNQTASKAILNYIATQNLPATDLNVRFDGASRTATVTGTVPDQATREKIALTAGNIHSVAHIDDQMTVIAPSAEARYYTVESGDTLSKISRTVYGDASKYNQIFEANKPMLTSPDRIYPGQMLRIPQAG